MAQVTPQAIAGAGQFETLTTLPDPFPLLLMVSEVASGVIAPAKVAVTEAGRSTVHVVAVPEQAPDQPENTDPDAAVIVTMTFVVAFAGGVIVQLAAHGPAGPTLV